MKRSVEDEAPGYFMGLEALKFAYNASKEEFVTEKLQNAAIICAIYLGGFRESEAIGLFKRQFTVQKSLEGREFVVVENAQIEKSGGKTRNCPIPPFDPVFIPLKSHLDSLGPDDLLFPVSRKTVYNIVDRASGGVIWPHYLRDMRNTFLARRFDKQERNKIMGWSSGGPRGQKARDMADRYEFHSWMKYADALALLTENYWSNVQIPPEVKGWLDSLSIISTTTTT